jgi:hypothetical protein
MMPINTSISMISMPINMPVALRAHGHPHLLEIMVKDMPLIPVFFVDIINGVLGTLRHTHVFGQGPLICVFKAFYTLKPRTGATER